MSYDKNLLAKLEKMQQKYSQLNDKMMDPSAMSSQDYAKVAKEHSDLGPIYKLAEQYKNLARDLDESKAMINDPAMDSEMKEFAKEEVISAEEKLEQLTKDIKVELLPKDEADSKNAILEVRAGTGGDEAALFAANLLRMYQRYAERHGWKFEILSMSVTGIEGCKEASAVISGKNVFAKLKFESGVHRVQRVPETESSGRIHTSAATVAVLPEAEEVDIEINESDLRIDVFRASGAGGQHVNTTESAVRITHLPTGVVVSQQDEKSQHKNKAKAMKILRSRVYDAERARKDQERSSLRKGLVGTGDRSERIRTYNYPQSRITDHRINLTVHNLAAFINEGDLDEVIGALTAQNQADLLAE